ncbi:MAG TPA: nuclear transport factor 2 family protein [Pyrinomonadaceae bacterium]|nr:nuclear transport factor 2 family protein [Pyrinomonadaceae bacterium]
MRKRIRLFWVLLFFTSSVLAQTERDKNELIQLTKEVSRASENRDAATFDRLMDDKLILYGGSNKTYSKKQLIAFWTKKDDSVVESSSTPDDFEVYFYGKTAIVICTITDTELNKKGETTTVKTKIFDVWQKQKKGWKWIASRETLLPEEKVQTK